MGDHEHDHDEQPVGLFFEHLKAELVTSARRDLQWGTRRRVRMARLVPVLGALLVGLAVLVAIRPPSAIAGIEVEREGDFFIVRLVDVEADAAGIEYALRQEGLRVAVEAVPAAPSKVGRFVQLHQRASGVPAFDWIDVSDGSAAGYRVPVSYTGDLRLVIGRHAWPWESYTAPASAYAPDEPLYCSDLWGMRVSEAMDRLENLGVRVRWEHFTGTDIKPVSNLVEISDMFVTDALSTAPREIQVTAAPTPESPLGTSAPPPCS